MLLVHVSWSQTTFTLTDTFAVSVMNMSPTSKVTYILKLTKVSPSQALVQDYILIPCGGEKMECRKLQREFYVHLIKADSLINETVGALFYPGLEAEVLPNVSSYYAISFLGNQYSPYQVGGHIAYKARIADKFYDARMKFKED